MRSRSDPTFVELARRRQILDGAIDLIAEQGFVNASIARIAKRVGVAKSAVLYYFAAKDDLVAAIVEQVFGDAARTMIPAVLAEDSPTGKLKVYIRSNCAFLDSHRTQSVALFEIMTSYRTTGGLRLDQAVVRGVEAQPPPPEMALLDPQHFVEEGVRTGEFPPVNALFVKNAIRAALDGAVSELARDPSYDVVAYGEQLVTLFGRALSTPSGETS
jgi:AcrR family transcriptional regulator